MTSPSDIKYQAFLSYSHADTATARRLHRRLEGFGLKGLSGRPTARGPIPVNLRPVFRDRHDFGAGAELRQATQLALAQSAGLVVLCSPAAAASKAVDAEIRLFRTAHPDRPLVPVIVDTARGVPAEVCLPPSLRFMLDGAGQPTAQPIVMLAADMRQSGDGFDLALAKVVAALVGLPSDEVYQRAERDRRFRAAIRNAIAASFVAIVGAGTWFYLESRRNETALFDAAAACQRYQPKTAAASKSALIDPVQSCIAALEALQVGAASDPRDAESLRLIGEGRRDDAERLQNEAANDDVTAGQARTKKAVERYRILADTAGLGDPVKARTYFHKALALDPDDWLSLMPLGISEMAEGNYPEAKALLERVLPLTGDRLELLKPIAKISLGGIASSMGDDETALSYLRDCGAGTYVPWDATESGRALFRDYRSLCNSMLQPILAKRGGADTALKLQVEDYEHVEDVIKNGNGLVGKKTDKISRDLYVMAASGQAYKLAMKMIELKRYDEAEKYARTSVAWADGPLADAPNEVSNLMASAQAHKVLADAILAEKQSDKQRLLVTLPEYLTAVKAAHAMVERLGDLVQGDQLYSECAVSAFSVLIDTGSATEALALADDVIAFAARRAKQGPLKPTVAQALAMAHYAHFYVTRASGDFAKASDQGRNTVAVLRGVTSLAENAEWQAQIVRFEGEVALVETRLKLEQLDVKATQSFEGGDYAAAAAIAAELAVGSENYETTTTGKTTAAVTGGRYLQLAWYRLFARDFAGSLKASEVAVKIDPAAIILGSNTPHALMFLGRTDEARGAYLAHRGERMAEGRGLWEEELLNDFSEFEKHGLKHPFMDEVRATFRKP